MNPSLEKTSSSITVLDKPKRPGGCVGIFFQLFDWNRRFAKKKLFSKKLLPPVRLIQPAKKFGGNEKQGKIRLIADENSGGFPTSKNSIRDSNCGVDHQKHEMRAPGLVARLMGLESMPASQRDKSRKVAGFVSRKGEKLVDDTVKGDLNIEKGGRVKHELKPPKLQKTSMTERRPVARFGAEKLPFKNVLSKSRKHHHLPKLPTPVKSQRSLLRKSSSRLIGAATRILEPGLQSNRSKYALAYSNASQHPARDRGMEERVDATPNLLEEFGGFLEGLQHCRHCGYNSDSKRLVSVSPIDHSVESSSQESSKPRHPESCRDFKAELFEDCPTLTTAAVDRVQPLVEPKCPSREQSHRHSGSQPCNVSSSSDNKITQSMDLVTHGLKPNDPRSRKVSKATVTTTVNGRARLQVPASRDNCKIESGRRNVNRMSDSVSPGRKRRPINILRHGESSSRSTIDNRTFGFRHSSLSGKQLGYIVSSFNRRSGLLNQQGETENTVWTDNNAASVSVSPSSKLEIGSRHFFEEKVKSGENSRTKKLEQPIPINGDALSALLEQKLKELNCQTEDTGGNAPKKPTGLILHELICSLTSEIPFQHDNSATTSYGRYSSCNHSCLSCSTSPAGSLGNEMAAMSSIYQPFDRDHLSPGSVLETYLSNESCLSCSSVGDCHGYKSMDCSHHKPQSPNPDSMQMLKSSRQSIADILNNVSEILCTSRMATSGLKGSMLDQSKEVLLNTELMFHNSAHSIKHLLLDDLETVASVLWINFGCCFGIIEDGKEGADQMMRFTIDSILEYLGLRFEGYPIAALQALNKVLLEMNSDMLMFEIVEFVRRWEKMSRFNLDELIEWEMGCSEWSRCEAEGWEAGVEISALLYQNLVDEIVTDLWYW